MIIKCSGCGYGGNVPDEKIPDQGVNITCPKCKTKFAVKKEVTPIIVDVPPATLSPRNTKPCPFCGEEILSVAKKCKHCNSMLDDVSPSSRSTNSASNNKPPIQQSTTPQKKSFFRRFGLTLFCVVAFICGVNVSGLGGYGVAISVISIWVLIDAALRNEQSVLWAIGTVLLGPITIPMYLAKRNLILGETREGGVAYNLLKNFAMFWTLIMAIVVIAGHDSISA